MSRPFVQSRATARANEDAFVDMDDDFTDLGAELSATKTPLSGAGARAGLQPATPSSTMFGSTAPSETGTRPPPSFSLLAGGSTPNTRQPKGRPGPAP